MYLDEYDEYRKAIHLRRIDDYRIKLAIARNPHLEPEKQQALTNALDQQERIYRPPKISTEKLDRDGFKRLKKALGKSRMVRSR